MHYLNNRYRQEHICISLKRAARHPYYRTHWIHRLRQIEETPCSASPQTFFQLLASLPVVLSTELSAIAPLLDDDDDLSVATMSSSVDGPLKFRYESLKERRLLRVALGDRRHYPGDIHFLTPASPQKPLRMNILREWDGQPGISFQNDLVLPGSIENDTTIMRTIELLGRDFDIPGCSDRVQAICASLDTIRILTRYLIDTGSAASDFAVKRIQTFGSYLGPRSHAWLTSYWNCTPQNVYSISECPQGGVICANCGYIDFSSLIVPAVVGLMDGNEIITGQGRLALTLLLPAGLTQPLVKYVTGDLVEWIPSGDACPEHVGGIRRLGRMRYSLVGEVNRQATVLMSSQDLHDIVDLDGVCRANPYAKLSAIRTNDVYAPRISLQTAQIEPGCYAVIVRYVPEMPVESSCAERIFSRFLEHPRIGPHILEGHLRLTVMEDPGNPNLPWNFA